MVQQKTTTTRKAARKLAPRKHIAGNVYGYLTVLDEYRRHPKTYYEWLCRCKCGNTTWVNSGSLTSGNTKSCGCLNRERVKKENESRKGPNQRRLEAENPANIKTIRSMADAFNMTKQRCYNPNQRDYKYYGGRGITVCDRWLESFDNFLEDMGLRPEGKTLERLDNNGPYSKENCVWANRKAQGNNTRRTKLITYEGQTLSVSQWARTVGMNPRTLHARLHTLGYTPEQAMTKPVKCGQTLEQANKGR